jgi:HK97 family phage major capsid protein
MPVQIKELKHKRSLLTTEARELNDQAEKEERGKSADEAAKFEALIAAAEALGEEIAQRERLEFLEKTVNANGDRTGEPLPHNEPRNLGKYSLLRAIRVMAARGKLDGIEGEVSAELQLRRKGTSGRAAQADAFTMPYDLPIDVRSAAMGRVRYRAESRAGFDTSAGAGGIPTILDTTYIEILRNRMACFAAGARVMADMIGNFAIPRQSAAGTAYWVAEGTAPTASNQTVDQVYFTPRTVGANTAITRRLAEQINTDAEMFVREDLAAIVARALDAAALVGLGSANQPTGILNNAAIPPDTTLGANGGPPTWALVVNLETSVAKANADLGNLAYMTNAVARGKMKQTTKIASPTYPIMIWGDGPEPVNGYPAFVTNQLPSNFTLGTSGAVCSPLLYGNWADLVFALWSGQDVIVDPYTQSTSGTLVIVTLQDADINVRHPASFAYTTGMLTT